MPTGIQNTAQDDLFHRLADLYARMEAEYDALASQLGLSCDQCPDNCCVSYFQHHTYIEWAYLWMGMDTLKDEHRQTVLDRARENVSQSRELLARGERPRIMCPLNEDGLCILYPYRLMICRLHGVPNQVRMPNGQIKQFPGCRVCQDLTAHMSRVPVLDRTPLYIQLAQLERDFLGPRCKQLPKGRPLLASASSRGQKT